MADKEQNRIDFGNFNQLSRETAKRLIRTLRDMIPEVDAIVINQQVPSGIHTDCFREQLVALIAEYPEKLFMADSRDYNGSYTGASLKMNEVEATRLCGFDIDPDQAVSYQEACQAAEQLFKQYDQPVFVTCGSRGSVAMDANGLVQVPGLLHLTRIDSVGAGDSYLAGAVSALAAGYNVEIAATTGSLVAGVTVRKLFETGTASPDEVIEIGTDTDYVYNPELAEDLRQARYLKGTDIEVITEPSAHIGFSHAIFDHDGTVSTMREGWEKLMAPMMIKAILGDQYQTADKKLYRTVEQRVHDLIDRTTGIQTLAQMACLVEMVREFGLVPEERILDIHGYKKIYNEDLLRMVRLREKKLKNGELELSDLTMKNAVDMVRVLKQSGIRIYLASGTDREDVVNEAKILGYEDLFDGGIYGAVGDIKKEVKKIILERILKEIDTSGPSQIITFGDGPVEIRETKKRGGLTIGVASDEVKRFGLNPKKRTRLVKAGADIVIPDFSQMGQLIQLLHIN